MTLRNLLWLAPREASGARARAPGVLCALDTRPDGILGRELVAEGLQLVHTIYEGELVDIVCSALRSSRAFLAEDDDDVCQVFHSICRTWPRNSDGKTLHTDDRNRSQ